MPTVPQRAVEEEQEHFLFNGVSLNIAAMRYDMGTGKLKPKKSTLDRAFIENYATQVHGLRLDAPQATNISIMSGVRAVDVQQVPDEAFSEPVIFAYLGKNKGMLNLGDGANYVLADGNKRLGKAFFAGRESLDVVILSQAQTRKYFA